MTRALPRARRAGPLVLAAAAALASAGCASIAATQNSEPAVSGELWYVKQRTFFGLVFSSTVWYCHPPEKGAARCVEAKLFDHGQAPEESGGSAGSAAPAAPTADPHLWRVATKSVELAVACGQVKTVLAADEACVEEQCRAPLELSRLFMARCKEQNAADSEAVVKLRESWRKQMKGNDGGPCYSTLKRAIRIAEVAEEYTTQCLKGREPGNFEKMILDGKGRAPKKAPAPAE